MSKKKAITSNSSNKPQAKAKTSNWNWLTMSERLKYWNRTKITDDVLDQLAEELIEWAQRPDAFKLAEFTTERGILYNTFDNWLTRHQNLKDATEYAKQRIGVYREKLAVFKEHNCNPGTLNVVMGHYCPVWKEERQFESDLRSQEKAKEAGNVTVHIDSFKEEE